MFCGGYRRIKVLLIANMYHRGFKDNIVTAFNNIAANVNVDEKEITFN